MTHLCLGISASDLQAPGGHEEALLLFRSGLVKQGGQEHAQVKVQRRRPSVHKALKKHQGCAFERTIIRGERINNVDRVREGEKKNLL